MALCPTFAVAGCKSGSRLVTLKRLFQSYKAAQAGNELEIAPAPERLNCKSYFCQVFEGSYYRLCYF